MEHLALDGCKISLRMRTRIALIAAFGAAMVSTWFIYSRVTQARRDDAYRTAIAPYQRDLHVGMARADVDKYLDARHVAHYPVRFGGSDGLTYEIKVWEDPGSLICEWNVYIALEFGPTDALTDVHIRKEGTCI
jgi:hypothetical protein